MNYFTKDEFVMGDINVFHFMDSSFLKKLDSLRRMCGFSLTVNSSYRDKAYNASVGGASKSKHMLGIACDLHCVDSKKRAVLVKAALELGLTVGVGRTFVHVDNRANQIMFTY